MTRLIKKDLGMLVADMEDVHEVKDTHDAVKHITTTEPANAIHWYQLSTNYAYFDDILEWDTWYIVIDDLWFWGMSNFEFEVLVKVEADV